MTSSILFKYERSRGHLFALSWDWVRRVAWGSVVSEWGECCFGVMYCEWDDVCDFVVLSVVEVCADYGGVNVFHVCLNFGVVYGVGGFVLLLLFAFQSGPSESSAPASR